MGDKFHWDMTRERAPDSRNLPKLGFLCWKATWMLKRATEDVQEVKLSEIELIHGDCMVFMATLPDKAFELAIVDPVYGHNITGGHKSENGWRSKEYWGKASNGWNILKTEQDYFIELFRISRNQIIWGGNYFHLRPSEGWIVWDKGQRDFSLADAELAWTSFDRATRVFNYARALSNFKDGERIHPTQKPIKLYEWLLVNYAKQGDRILDTHGGSMSIAIACINLGHDLTLLELDNDYFLAGTSRVKTYLKQSDMFREKCKLIINDTHIVDI